MSESHRTAGSKSADSSSAKYLEQSTSHTTCESKAHVFAELSAIAEEKQEAQIDWLAQERKALKLVAEVEAREGLRSGEAVHGEDQKDAQKIGVIWCADCHRDVEYCNVCGEGYCDCGAGCFH